MTDRPEQSDITSVVAALKKSGFPLQTRVEHEITARAGRGWKLLASEHPWRSEDGDQFVDLIAKCGMAVLVIECKKAQDRSLLFLRPLGTETTGPVRTCTIWHFQRNAGAGQPFNIGIEDTELEPESYKAAFCVATHNSGRRLLEEDARPVVLAIEALLSQRPPFYDTHELTRALFVPVIVTTARLYTLRYNPTEVLLETGSYTKLDLSKIEPIEWIRFHKSFTASGDRLGRTVFVVNAAALPRFLDLISRAQGFGVPAT
jgi:hypothetical protein